MKLEESFRLMDTESEYPIPINTFPKIKGNQFKDLSGIVVGKLTIMGYHSSMANNTRDYNKKNPKTGSKWVVRCDCGIYGIRRGITLNKAINKNDNKCTLSNMCSRCEYMEKTKNWSFE